ncbi:DUF4097 family beta strand repeat-containing protein [Longirhabdus pacifica]|uniref:DUF4097 family beta strand repeat-containing protein n=1 Tax=Longirhabdus pacifica TaxID=2305227 RepID=UPI0010092141|nr:DUF4097 family beta strand repeat-containing protein [Longirhabdus pacifica]
MKKIALLLIIVGFVGMVVSGTAVFSDSNVAEINEQKTVTAEESKDIQNINIQSSSIQHIILEATDSEEIQVSLEGTLSQSEKENMEFEVESKQDTLYVNVSTTQNILSIVNIDGIGSLINVIQNNEHRSTLHITIPNKVYDAVEIDTYSTDIEVQQVHSNDFISHTSSGNQHISAVQADDQFEVKSSSGDIKISTINTEDMLVKASSGNITAQEVEGVQIQLHTSSGTISLEQMDSKQIELHTSSGDIEAEDIVAEDITTKVTSGDIEIENKALKGNIYAKATSGDVNLTFEDPIASITLDYDGSSGSIDQNIDGLTNEKNGDHAFFGTKNDGAFEVKVRTTSGDFTLDN